MTRTIEFSRLFVFSDGKSVDSMAALAADLRASPIHAAEGCLRYTELVAWCREHGGREAADRIIAAHAKPDFDARALMAAVSGSSSGARPTSSSTKQASTAVDEPRQGDADYPNGAAVFRFGAIAGAIALAVLLGPKYHAWRMSKGFVEAFDNGVGQYSSHLPSARVQFDRLVSAQPTNAMFHRWSGHAAFLAGDYQAARSALLQAASLDSESRVNRREAGIAKLEMGVDARDVFRQLTSGDRTDRASAALFGCAMFASGERGRASRWMEYAEVSPSLCP